MRDTLSQPYVAMLSIYLGIAGGLLYSLFCVIKKTFKGALAKNICEIVYALVFGALCFVAYYGLLNLKLKVYYLWGIILGFLIYRAGIHRLFLFIGRGIGKIFKKRQ